ncbi:anti-sigma F factor antagonist SpoIIAA [Gottschalkia purinilytica]|uniref:Anti-sigma factor antagonist n=1 Tax=Gottschalkia purinilytica TaxID=1503 RepID=A0A0L0W760_GOTPU|nr:STAS domain-containing protein [Gottschalkia purinilytica]KNF07316.1 anti-sigma F factor antagonist SpoIIAA [Gottschalkia purinilytica]
MSLEVSKKYQEEQNVWIIKPVGEVDIYTSEEFKTLLVQSIEEKKSDLIVDGENLDYIDSTGLGVLISALKKAKEYEKSISIINIKPSIKKLFELTSLNKVFTIKE